MARKLILPKKGEWATTADIDGDLAIYDAINRQLVGVGATIQQTINIVEKHNAIILDWHDRAESGAKLIKKSLEK